MRIIYNAEDIGTLCGPSLNRGLVELHIESGVIPIVRAPFGGKRTSGQQQVINPGQYISDHVKGRAGDIWNWEAVVYGIARRRGISFAAAHLVFKGILSKWGWLNQQVNGAAFPSEPWHYANHLSTVRLLALTVKVLVTPSLKPNWRGQMRLVLNPNPRPTSPKNEYWVVGNGKPYLFVGTGPDREQAEATAFVKNIAAGPTLVPSKTQWANGYMKQFGG